MSVRKTLMVSAAYIAAGLVAFTAFDTGMRRDQARMCMIGDAVTCPTHLWWFDQPCETDGECEAVAGPF